MNYSFQPGGSTIKNTGGGGEAGPIIWGLGFWLGPRGAHVKILTGMLVLFFGFEIWPNPIFLGWQIF